MDLPPTTMKKEDDRCQVKRSLHQRFFGKSEGREIQAHNRLLKALDKLLFS
jgi:hypothetical protein